MVAPIAVRVRVEVPADAVLHALTDPVQLRAWLADDPNVALPHRYELRGRDIPWGTAAGQLLLHVDDRLLRFSWLLPDDATTVEIRLQDEPHGPTVVRLSQSEVGDPATREALHAFWTLALANLVDHLDGRRPVCRCGYTTSVMRMDIAIDAPAPAVYESLLATDHLIRSFTFPQDFDPRIGGTHGSGGQVVRLDPDREVAIENVGLGVTTFRITSADGGTRLALIDRASADAPPPYAARARALSTLAEVRRFHERGARRRSRRRRWRFTVDMRSSAVNVAERAQR